MSYSRSNSKPRVPVSKDSKKPSVTAANTKENKADPGRSVNTKGSNVRTDKSRGTVSNQSNIHDATARSISKDRTKGVPARAISKDRAKEPVTRGISKDRAKEPVTRGISKETTTSKAVSKNITTSRTVASKLNTVASKSNTVVSVKKATDATKLIKSISPRTGTATISKSQERTKNGGPRPTVSKEKPDKTPKLSGSRTATKEKPPKSEENSEKEERPSTVNLSSRKGENRVIRNAESIIANNEAVLSSSESVTPALEQDSLDAEVDYEDDFDDYESDFEVDDEDYNDDDEGNDDDIDDDEYDDGGFASTASDKSFSVASGAGMQYPKTADNTDNSSKENGTNSDVNSSKGQSKPTSLSLYEDRRSTDWSPSSPMSPITVTPMTPSVPLLTPATPSSNLLSFAQAEHSIIQRKNKSRASELLELITLDKQTFSIYDSPPANYEVFIKIFGNNNHKQAFVQTEESEDQLTQTDDIDTLDKWTQNPSHGLRAVGGDLISETVENWKVEVNGVKLSSFIENASSLVLKILDEQTSEVIKNSLTRCDINVPFSSGFFEPSVLDFIADQPIKEVCFSQGQPMYLLSTHCVETNLPLGYEEKSILCVWDLKNQSRPEYILEPSSVVSKCCFNPGNPTIVFAGMLDGSIALWDLREQNHQHKLVSLTQDLKAAFRSPTYNTAALDWEMGHHSAIIALQTFVYQVTSTSGDTQNDFLHENEFCNLLTLEDLCVLNIWAVVGVGKPDSGNSDSDLGLAPMGNLKLLKTGSISVSTMLPSSSVLSLSLRSFDFQIEPSSPHNLFITTDAGVILHCTRQGQLAMPRLYEADVNQELRCLAFNPHRLPHFAAGCNDGTIYIFNTRSGKPCLKCMYKPYCIVSIQWSVIRPTVFYALDSKSCIQIWDLASSSTTPLYMSEFPNGRVTYFSVVSDRMSNSQWSQYLVLSLHDGHIKVFKLVDNIISVTSDEYDLLRNIMNDL